MANTVINPVFYAKATQPFLRSALVMRKIARTTFGNVLPNSQVVYPYVSTARVQDYSYSTDATIDAATFTTNGYTINKSKIVTQNYDPLQNMQATDMSWQTMMAEECAYQLQRNMDQYGLQTGLDAALNTVAGGSLSSSNTFEALTSCRATLDRSRAGTGAYFYVTDPTGVATLANTDKANGFDLADSTLKNGYVGSTSAGFKVYMSNDLPYSVPLTLITQPTDGDTVTIYGKVFTFKTTLGVDAGQVLIGANAAAAQANLRSAVNGTSGSGSTYIDLVTDDRRELQNAQVAMSAFSSNIATITAYGKISGSETLTAVADVFGTETVQYLLGLEGAIDFTAQAEPEVEERLPTGNKSRNILTTCQYGSGVFYRMKAKLVKLTANA